MALNDLGEGDLRVARAVRNLSLASAGDIAAVQRRTDSGVHTRLRALSDENPGRCTAGGVGGPRLLPPPG